MDSGLSDAAPTLGTADSATAETAQPENMGATIVRHTTVLTIRPGSLRTFVHRDYAHRPPLSEDAGLAIRKTGEHWRGLPTWESVR